MSCLEMAGRILCDTPQHAGRIGQAEVTHSPRLLHDFGYRHRVCFYHAATDDSLTPCVDVFDQHVHLEVVGESIGAKVLQQEAGGPAMEIGDATAFDAVVEPMS